MGFGSNDDNDNDLPDWLKGLQSEDDNGGLDSEGGFLPKEDDIPDWLEDEDEGGFDVPEPHAEGSEEQVPDWLAKIREEEKSNSPFTDEPAEEVEEADAEADDAWLKNIQEQYRRDHGEEPPEEEDEEEPKDYIARIRALKDEDTQAPDLWGDDKEPAASRDADQDPVAAAWEADTGTLSPIEDDEEDVPDWVIGLPAVDPEDNQVSAAPESEEGEETPPWLREIRARTTEETRPPDDVLPEFGLNPEDMYLETPAEEAAEDSPEEAEETPQAGPAFSERPAVTGSLPSWLEDLQSSGQIEPFDSDEEEMPEASIYSEEDVSTLFEQDDLPDWLQPEEETFEEAPQESAMAEGLGEPESLEKAELPTWLQAMRPVEAVTADLPDEPEEEEAAQEKKKETIGPLSGLSDVLPAEPHIVHFGNKPKPAAHFELTEPQKKYAQLLKSLVDTEASYTPMDTRKVANPQQVLRWVIAILLLTLLFAMVWLNGDFIPLPAQGFPEENLAVVSMVNELQPGEKVLVAFEYQPGLAGEMEAASSALIEHLLLREAQLVLVSTQPVGPGLAETYLQGQYQNSAYVAQKGYANLGYVAGGAAGLLTFASDPRQAKPHMAWNTAPLDSITFIRDFAMVLVITDDPDIARNWIEQVQPLLAAPPGGEQIPMVMVTSAQAEPLVYPYYLSEPRQVSGMVSGVSGGAYYETVIDPSLARRYWDGYNVGLIVAVLVIAVGSIINLTRNSLKGLPGGRS